MTPDETANKKSHKQQSETLDLDAPATNSLETERENKSNVDELPSVKKQSQSRSQSTSPPRSSKHSRRSSQRSPDRKPSKA